MKKTCSNCQHWQPTSVLGDRVCGVAGNVPDVIPPNTLLPGPNFSCENFTERQEELDPREAIRAAEHIIASGGAGQAEGAPEKWDGVRIHNASFDGCLVNLDGVWFEQCEFHNCKLKWNGGRVYFKACHLEGQTTILTDNGLIADTIKLLGFLGGLKGNLGEKAA